MLYIDKSLLHTFREFLTGRKNVALFDKGHITNSEPAVPETEVRNNGFYNGGSYCYQNSSLHFMHSIPSIRNTILKLQVLNVDY